MESAEELQQQSAPRAEGIEEITNSISLPVIRKKLQLPKLVPYKWWLRITAYTMFILVGQSAAVLLGRLYFNEGGNSKWIATFVQSSGFPILLPLLFYFRGRRASKSGATTNLSSSASASPSFATFAGLYVFFGILLAGDNLMYSYGLVYVPVSTYSLLCATQLAFNAVFAYFLNKQKFTSFILNSLVLLTVSAGLLAIHSDNESLPGVSRGQYVIGFILTIGASATYSLYLSLVQLSFEKIIRRETFLTVLDMQIFSNFVATCVCVVGLFASGEWRELSKEMNEYNKGVVSYLMTLIWTAISWTVMSVGLLGLIFEVSSLFTNVISTLGTPIVPVLAVVFFKDKMDGVKVIALFLAVWGFTSYMYQHYLDDAMSKKTEAAVATSSGGGEPAVDHC